MPIESVKQVVDQLRGLISPQNIFSSVFVAWEDETFPFAGREIDRVAGRLSYDYTQYGISWPLNARYQDEDSVIMGHQLKHAWKLGSDIYPHIHWYPTYDPLADNPTYPGELYVPNWTLRYRINKNNAAPGTWQTVALVATEAASGYTWTLGDLVVSRFPAIDMSAYTDDGSLSCIIDYQILRDVDNLGSGIHPGAEADWSTPAPCTIKTFDSHIQKDSLGSVLQWMKRAA